MPKDLDQSTEPADILSIFNNTIGKLVYLEEHLTNKDGPSSTQITMLKDRLKTLKASIDTTAENNPKKGAALAFLARALLLSDEFVKQKIPLSPAIKKEMQLLNQTIQFVSDEVVSNNAPNAPMIESQDYARLEKEIESHIKTLGRNNKRVKLWCGIIVALGAVALCAGMALGAIFTPVSFGLGLGLGVGGGVAAFAGSLALAASIAKKYGEGPAERLGLELQDAFKTFRPK